MRTGTSESASVVVRDLIRYHDDGTTELDRRGEDAVGIIVAFELDDGTAIDVSLSEDGTALDVRVVGMRGATALSIEPKADNAARLKGRDR